MTELLMIAIGALTALLGSLYFKRASNNTIPRQDVEGDKLKKELQDATVQSNISYSNYDEWRRNNAEILARGTDKPSASSDDGTH